MSEVGAAASSRAPNRLAALQRIAITIGPPLLRALYATWRVRVVNDGGWRALHAKGQSFVFSLWHGELLPLVIEHRNQGVRILISEHGDGEVIARIAQRLGLAAIRGSTTRGAARALLAMSDALAEGSEIAVTPDGPRGPAHTYAAGALIAAQRARAPIVAIGVSASRAWRLRSWDSFLIPKPFATVAIAYSDPEYVTAVDARSAALQSPHFEQLMMTTAARARARACET